jgi:hypothetical protein
MGITQSRAKRPPTPPVTGTVSGAMTEPFNATLIVPLPDRLPAIVAPGRTSLKSVGRTCLEPYGQAMAADLRAPPATALVSGFRSVSGTDEQRSGN